MAGSVLSPDQVARLNAAYPRLVAHVRSLLQQDHTGYGLMKVHLMVESFDSDEMAAFFRDISFISPKERTALVRAAIYELIVTDTALFAAIPGEAPAERPAPKAEVEAPKTFTPPQFRLNVNKAEGFHGERKADTPAPKSIVTSTHTPTVQRQVQDDAKGS